MVEETEIMEMSGLANEEIARRVLQLLNESRFERFTLILKRSRLKNDSKDCSTLFKLEEISNRSKSMSLEKFQFSAQLQRSSSFSNNESLEHLSCCETLTPLQMAHRLYALGRHQQSLELLSELKEEYDMQGREQPCRKDYKELLVSLGNCEYQLKNYPEAINLYKRVIGDYLQPADQNLPETAKLYNNIGSAYAHLNLEKLSMNAYSHAINIYHHYPSMDCSALYANIANIYSKCRMLANAESYYLKAIAERKQKKPTQKDLLFHVYRKLSETQMQMKKYKEAEDSLNRAQKLAEHGHGELVEILKESAILRETQNKWEQAIEFYEKLHSIHSQNSDQVCKGYIYQKTSRIYHKIGKLSEHQKYRDKAVEQYRRSGNLCKVMELTSTHI